MFAVRGIAIRCALMAAVNCVELTNVVTRDSPFHSTTELDTKPLPFTVSVNAGPPVTAEIGLSEEIAGPAAIANGTGELVTPVELTAILTVPGVAIRAAGTKAVS
jgi:hypothetical protein